MTERKYAVSVPEGTSGIWTIEKFEVGESGVGNIRNQISAFTTGRTVPDGNYTRLCRGLTTVMSDTPDEYKDCVGAIYNSKGKVLIVGLGLGMVLQEITKRPEVNHVTVIEKSHGVIELVSEHYNKMFGDKINIIEADIFKWKPKKEDHWDCVWFDIWDDLCTDNLSEMATLHRRFGRKADWKGSWGKEFLQYKRDQERRNYW